MDAVLLLLLAVVVVVLSLNDTCFEFAVANGASDTVVCFALFLNLIPDHNATYNPDELRKKVHPLASSSSSCQSERGDGGTDKRACLCLLACLIRWRRWWIRSVR